MRRSTAADVMTTAVLSVRPETPTAQVRALLHDRQVRAVPVVDAGGRLLGVVSEADVMVALERADTGPRHPWRPRHIRRPGPGREKAGAATAGELMSTPVVTAAPTDPVARLARILREHRLSWLPVLDDENRVVGVVGRSDLLAAYVRPDEDIRREIVDDVAGRILVLEPGRLDATVRDGMVTLHGRLDTHADTELAGRLVERVEGVVEVASELTWDVDERVGATRIGPFY